MLQDNEADGNRGFLFGEELMAKDAGVGTFAQSTTVTIEKSRADVERLLEKFGTTAFAYFRSELKEQVAFAYRKMAVRLDIPVPSPSDDTIRLTPAGHDRAPAEIEKRWRAEHRRRWRCLFLVVKAKLVGIADGIETFEEAFLAHMVIGGHTLGERIVPQLERARETGVLELPAMLSTPTQGS